MGEKERVGVIEQGVKPVVFGGRSGECLDLHAFRTEIPIKVGTRAFFRGGRVGAKNSQFLQVWVPALRERLGELPLILAFRVDRFLPKGFAKASRSLDLCAGEKRVGGAADRQEDAGGAEVLANDQRDTSHTAFRQQMAMKNAPRGRHEDSRDILQRHFSERIAYSAEELSVLAEELRFLVACDLDEVIGHAGIPVRR